MTGRRILVGTFLLTIIVLTWDEIREQKRVPVPRRYVSAGAVYGVLGIVSTLGAPEVAAVFAVGVLLAQIYTVNKAATAAAQQQAAQDQANQSNPAFHRME